MKLKILKVRSTKMICTSYFANRKNFPDGVICGVCRYPPQGLEINFDQLAPSADLLKRLKDKEIDEFVFEYEYKKYLNSLSKKNWRYLLQTMERLHNNVILCCYEKTGDFCHRHILADWLDLNIKEI